MQTFLLTVAISCLFHNNGSVSISCNFIIIKIQVLLLNVALIKLFSCTFKFMTYFMHIHLEPLSMYFRRIWHINKMHSMLIRVHSPSFFKKCYFLTFTTSCLLPKYSTSNKYKFKSYGLIGATFRTSHYFLHVNSVPYIV